MPKNSEFRSQLLTNNPAVAERLIGRVDSSQAAFDTTFASRVGSIVTGRGLDRIPPPSRILATLGNMVDPYQDPQAGNPVDAVFFTMRSAVPLAAASNVAIEELGARVPYQDVIHSNAAFADANVANPSWRLRDREVGRLSRALAQSGTRRVAVVDQYPIYADNARRAGQLLHEAGATVVLNASGLWYEGLSEAETPLRPYYRENGALHVTNDSPGVTTIIRDMQLVGHQIAEVITERRR